MFLEQTTTRPYGIWTLDSIISKQKCSPAKAKHTQVSRIYHLPVMYYQYQEMGSHVNAKS